MSSPTIIFDSTFTRNYRVNNEPAWDEPLPGCSLCAWVALWTVMPWAPPKYVPKASDLLRVIDAVIAKRGFPTGKDVYRYYGPAPFMSRTNFPAKATPHSFQLDWELPWLDNASPNYYADIIRTIRTKHPGIRLTTFVPQALFGFPDEPLKTQHWVPDQRTIDLATAYAQRNKAWIDQLWGLTITCYFGQPRHDESSIWLYYNLIKLARIVYPGRRIIAHTCAQRNEGWYAPGGPITDAVTEKWAGVLRTAHPEGIIVWGLRSANLKLLNALGIKAAAPPIVPPLSPVRLTPTTATLIKEDQ